MNMNTIIMNTLKPLNIPIAFQQYAGSNTTYITFFELIQMGKVYADDAEQKTSHSVQIDVWSKEDYTGLVDRVKEQMLAANFTRAMETELYEPDTKTYHKVLRFNYVN